MEIFACIKEYSTVNKTSYYMQIRQTPITRCSAVCSAIWSIGREAASYSSSASADILVLLVALVDVCLCCGEGYCGRFTV